MTQGTTFFTDTISTLRALHTMGARTGIVSTKTRSRIEEKLRRDEVMDTIDFILGIEDVREPKPSPEGLRKAMERFGAQPAETLYTGDSYIDAEAARNAGVPFAAVLTGSTTAEVFASYPYVKLMKQLGELLDL